MIGEDYSPIASGTHDWQNRLEGGIWTYTEQDITLGLQSAYKDLADSVKAKYGVQIKKAVDCGFLWSYRICADRREGRCCLVGCPPKLEIEEGHSLKACSLSLEGTFGIPLRDF